MGHYRSNLRDLEFTMFEISGLDRILESGGYDDLDVCTVRRILDEVRRLAEGPFAASFADADRNPPVFDAATHTVRLPDSLKRSVRTALEAGYDKVGLSPEIGGTRAPQMLYWAIWELFLGANPAAQLYTSGAQFADILYHLGAEEQRCWVRAR